MAGTHCRWRVWVIDGWCGSSRWVVWVWLLGGRWPRWPLLGRWEVWARLLGRRWARWSSLGSLVVVGLAGRRWACWSSLGSWEVLLIVELYCWRWVWSWWWLCSCGCRPRCVVSAMVVVAVFFLVATCRFEDTGWVSLFEAGKMREMDHDICHGPFS